MGSKLILSLILLSSWVLLGFSQGTGGGTGVESSCITKLLPCQASLKDPTSPPPTCCLPLKQMVEDDPKCLCDVFNNPQLLKGLNVTQEDALKLPKGCGITTVDTTKCSKLAGPPTNSSATSPAPAASNGTAGTPDKKNSGDGLSPFGALGFIATFVALLSALI